ncbi:MAG: SLC13 family permease [Desulfobacterales bacterium]|jgi:di/tricarboxylate transporter
MTPDIALTLFILATAVVLLITEWIPMEVTALLALGAVALTGLVSPVDALAGFSNPAVVTVWAVFILSGGLTLTGVANIIGGFVRRIAGRSEISLIVVIMLSAGIMSAIMNNVAVAALMLPVVIGLAHHTHTPPSRLLMPLAYGCLLGGLTTQIGTPPNILVTDALQDNGFKPFTFFDFTPVGLIVMFSGITFMAIVGRHMLPRRDVIKESSSRREDLSDLYGIQQHLFSVRIPPQSPLVNKTLAASRMHSAVGLNVIGISRADRTLTAPGPSELLQAGDLLTVEGHSENFMEVSNWNRLVIEDEPIDFYTLVAGDLDIVECRLTSGSQFCGQTLLTLDFRNQFGAIVLALRRDDSVKRVDLQHIPLQADDVLLIMGRKENLQNLEDRNKTDHFQTLTPEDIGEVYSLHTRLLAMRVPKDSVLAGKTLKESRLGAAMGIRILSIKRKSGRSVIPEPSEILQSEDHLIVEARREDIMILEGLRGLQVDRRFEPRIEKLTAGDTGLVEAILSPQTALVGKTLRQLAFREKYGLNVLSVWRQGEALFSDLPDLPLRFGDALLLFGPHQKLQLLGREPDFIVLREIVQEITHPGKAKTSTLVMVAVLLPVIMGWVPIYIAAVIGAALMVLMRCLTMEEAYRQIEWKAVFLIAGMLPLGTALDQTGAAKLIAEGVVALVGPYGPKAVMFGLVSLTFLATCFIPTAALVVLMAPIVFNTSASMGLSPYGLLMAVAMAASASFTTPIAHPANILVMGPGGYRFIDYLKIGGLLTVVILAVIIIAVPIFWPLQP